MKKIVNILLIILLTISFIPNVYAANTISIDNITLVEKSDDVIEYSKPKIDNMNLSFDLGFLNIGNYAKYKVEISNNTNKDYYLDKENKFNNSSYVSYIYEFDNNINKINKNSKVTMYITIKYEKNVPLEKLVNGIYLEEKSLSIDLSDVILTNPSTYSNILILFLIVTILLIVTIIKIKKKQKVGINILLIGLLLIPITTKALEKITIKVQTKISIEEQRNVIESRYINGNTSTERDFWQYYDIIKTITFETKIEEPSNYAYKFDVSEAKNNKIIAYLIPNEENNSYYDLYIMSNGYIYGNSDSSSFFKNNSINQINNIEYFKTNYVTDMSWMFSTFLGGLSKLDLSSFDTSNVTTMESIFDSTAVNGGLGEIKEINISNWDTRKVTNMKRMFYNCSSLVTLDLSSFDTANVRNMTRMFYDCNNLTNIYISDTWNVDNVNQSAFMFYNCLQLPNFVSTFVAKDKANTSETGYLTLKS